MFTGALPMLARSHQARHTLPLPGWWFLSGGIGSKWSAVNDSLYFLVHVFFPMPSQEGGVNIHAMIWYIVIIIIAVADPLLPLPILLPFWLLAQGTEP